MDKGYGTGTGTGADPTVLKAIHTSPYLDNLFSVVRQPLPSWGSTLPLPDLCDLVAPSVKCEDMSNIFPTAATLLDEKTLINLPESTFSSLSAWDLRVSSTSTSTLPMFAATGMAAASSCGTSTSYHGSSVNYKLPCLPHSVASTLRDPYELPELGDYHGLVSSASFSEIMLHAMEISEANSNRLLLSRCIPDHPTTSAVHIAQSASVTEGMSHSSLMFSKLSSTLRGTDVPGSTPNTPESSPNSPSKQDSSVVSAEDSDADRKLLTNNITKRRNCGLRKTQQKKVVCIPFGESKQSKGDQAPPSDTWTWRKYGQKPIKGSPFPRGYYRCSSSKGCPARKQVERSRSDPTMVMVTYTADHNHSWPANRSLNPSTKAGCCKDRSQAMEDASNYQRVENLFSSIINAPNAVDEQLVSSMTSLQEDKSFFLQRDVDLCLSRTSTESDDVFDDLGELPELSTIFFSKGYIGEGQFDEAGNCEEPEFL